jgi:hypothetical protein
MGRKPEGEAALTGAERQARYRARHDDAHVIPDRQPAKTPSASRPQRWHAAVNDCSPCRPKMQPGSTLCRKPPATARPGKHCRPMSSSIWTRSPRSGHHAALAATRRGHDRLCPIRRQRRPAEPRQPYVPHDTLPARPCCAGACPGTEQQRSGQIMSYQNRTG